MFAQTDTFYQKYVHIYIYIYIIQRVVLAFATTNNITHKFSYRYILTPSREIKIWNGFYKNK